LAAGTGKKWGVRVVGISETGSTLTVSDRPCSVNGQGCCAENMWFSHTRVGMPKQRSSKQLGARLTHGFRDSRKGLWLPNPETVIVALGGCEPFPALHVQAVDEVRRRHALAPERKPSAPLVPTAPNRCSCPIPTFLSGRSPARVRTLPLSDDTHRYIARPGQWLIGRQPSRGKPEHVQRNSAALGVPSVRSQRIV
jgi:hypothetical protein